MSEEPDPMDVPAVLEHLNAAVRLQYRSALQYLIVASGGRGAHALAVGAQLREYAEAEFADAGLLVSKIVALGGEPDVEVAPLAFEPVVEDGIRHLIECEKEALAAIHAVIPPSGQLPESEALEHLVEHVIMRKQNQLDVLARTANETSEPD